MVGFGGKTFMNGLARSLLYQTSGLAMASVFGPIVLALYNRPLALVQVIRTFTSKFAHTLTPIASASDDTTIAAGMFDPDVKSVADYIERMRLFVVPMQSMVLADAGGRIGLIAPGRVPVRDPANKVAGRAPVPGWDATYDWKGYLKFEALPRVDGPEVGAIGTANARMVDPDYPNHLTYDWDAAFRQQRIKELIFDRDKHDVDSMKGAQTDVLSLAILRLQPLMIAAAQAGGAVDDAVLDQLTAWDATMRPDRAEPLIFTAWMREAMRAIYRDDLGAALHWLATWRGAPVRFPVLQKDKFHMTGKPSALMRRLVEVVPPGARILDPFMGSDTTGVASVSCSQSDFWS
jgi:hypothetical protein